MSSFEWMGRKMGLAMVLVALAAAPVNGQEEPAEGVMLSPEEAKAEFTYCLEAYDAQREAFEAGMREWLLAVEADTPEELELSRADYIRANFDAFVALKAAELELRDAARALSSGESETRAIRETLREVQPQTDDPAELEYLRAYRAAALELIKLEEAADPQG